MKKNTVGAKLAKLLELFRQSNNIAASVYVRYLFGSSDRILTEAVWEVIDKAIKIYKEVPASKAESHNSLNAFKWASIGEKLLGNKKVHVLFLNDIGFNAGAGIGMHRQAQSFLNEGHDISVLAFHPKPDTNKINLELYDGKVLNCVDCSHLLSSGKLTSHGLVQLLGYIIDISPDIVITGNLHARALPSNILSMLNGIGFPVVAYAHDCDWVTGGCAHFLYHECSQYLIGCDSESCPKTQDSYPPLDKKNVSKNWLHRDRLFQVERIPIAVNSEWMKNVFVKRFGDKSLVSKVLLGLNTDVYKPIDKRKAKNQLGIDPEVKVILAGSGFLGTRGKGSEYLFQLFEQYKLQVNVKFALLGNSSGEEFPPNVIHLGYVTRDEELALVYSAADVFVNPVSVESFGQTMLEAISCLCPIVSFNECGVGEVSIDGMTAVHSENSVASLSAAIDKLIYNPDLSSELQRNGRFIVEEYFSLAAQFNNWREFIIATSYEKRKEVRKTLPNLYTKNDPRYLRSKPLVSVVSVTYNVGHEFVRTAESVLSQKNVDFEWIVIDGNSKGEGLNILSKYSSFFSVFVSESDKGIYDAMNKAVEYANGEFVIYLGSGDSFSSQYALSRFSRNLSQEPDIVFGNVFELRQDGTVIQTDVVPFEKKWGELKSLNIPHTPLMKGLPPHQATFVRLDVLRENKFDLNYKVSADWDLIYRLYAKNYRFKKVDTIFAWYPNGGFSAVHSLQWLKDVRKIMLKYVEDISGLNSYFDKVEANQQKVVDRRLKEGKLKERYQQWIDCGYENTN